MENIYISPREAQIACAFLSLGDAYLLHWVATNNFPYSHKALFALERNAGEIYLKLVKLSGFTDEIFHKFPNIQQAACEKISISLAEARTICTFLRFELDYLQGFCDDSYIPYTWSALRALVKDAKTLFSRLARSCDFSITIYKEPTNA